MDSDEEEVGYDDDDGFDDNKDNFFMPVNTEEEIELPDYENTTIESVLKANAANRKIELGPKTEALYGLEYDDEKLGDDFEENPWKPPNCQRSLEFKENQLYRAGRASTFSCMTDLKDLGAGIPLYFQFARSITVCLFCMSLLALPALVLAYNGSRIPQQDRDIIGLYQFTIGNIGYNNESPTYDIDSKCIKQSDLIKELGNQTCIHLFNDSIEITQVTASAILTTMEFLQIVIFFITVYHMRRMMFKKVEDTKVAACKIKDYSVLVEGLPPDTTAAELCLHFSSLYYLHLGDWRGRPPLKDAEPVEHVDNTQNTMFLEGWVADCSLYHRIGDYIDVFKLKQKLMTQLYKYRSQIKMYSNNTPHANGGNEKLKEIAVKNMMKTAGLIDQATKKIRANSSYISAPVTNKGPVKKAKVKTIYDSDNSDGDEDDFDNIEKGKAPTPVAAPIMMTTLGMDGKPIPPPAIIIPRDKEVVAAFITFDYPESQCRCIDDYSTFNQFPWSLCYPEQLKFRGKIITVRPAPEPDDVVWDSLEYSVKDKRLLSMKTNVIVFLMVLIGFIIILQASAYQSVFMVSMPDMSICHDDIPTIYKNSSINLYKNISLHNIIITRPLDDDKDDLDLSCELIIHGSYYAIMTENGDLDKPIGQYDLNACLQSSANAVGYAYYGTCPHYGQEIFCPCVLTSVSEIVETCQTSSCKFGSNDKNCVNYDSHMISSCHCNDKLYSLIDSGGPLDALLGFVDIAQKEDITTCNVYFTDYAQSTSLTYLGILVTVILNHYITLVVKYFVHRERHGSVDDLQESLFSKVFFSVYLNTAFVVLVSYGYLPLGGIFERLQIFQGPCDDFNSKWYGNVGLFIALTFVFQSFSSIFHHCWIYYCGGPCHRTCLYPRIQAQKASKISMQYELDLIEVGPVFNHSSHNSQLLISIFLVMTYGTGLPILTVLGFLVFWTYYRYDKSMLLYYYQEPPHSGDQVMKRVIQLLPYAAIIRLLLGMWMFGNPSFLESGIVTSTMSDNVLKNAPASLPSYMKGGFSALQYQDWLASNYHELTGFSATIFDITTRIIRANVFPLFVLLIIIICAKIIRKLWKALPIYWILKMLACIMKSILGSHVEVFELDADGFVDGYHLFTLNDENRKESAAFTKKYFRYVRLKEIPKKGILEKIFCFCRGKKPDLTDDEAYKGWVTAELGPYIIKQYPYEQMTVLKSSVTRIKGEPRTTYEMILDEDQCGSYDMDKVPAFRMMLFGVNEITSSLIRYQNKLRIPLRGHTIVTIRDLITTVLNETPIASPYILDKYISKHKNKVIPTKGKSIWDKDGGGYSDSDVSEDSNGVKKKKKKKSSGDPYAAGEGDSDTSEEEVRESGGLSGGGASKEEEEDSDGSGLF